MSNDLSKLLKQAQHLQTVIEEKQKKLANATVIGTAGADMVKVEMTCTYQVKQTTLDPALLEEKVEILQDLLTIAFNDAVKKAQQTSASELGGITQGLNFPGGFNPFATEH